MDFNKKQDQSRNTGSTKKQSSALTYKAGSAVQASSTSMLPKPVAAKLMEISKSYGLPLDLSSITLQEATPQKVKALRGVVSLIANNSQLLPEILKLAKQLLNADIKLSGFHKKLTEAALEHQTTIDKDTADIFLQMAGYAAGAAKLQYRTNTRNELIDKRRIAYENLYENSVFGNESRVIDAEYELLASDRQILADSKIQRKKATSERKQAARAYIDQAFEN